MSHRLSVLMMLPSITYYYLYSSPMDTSFIFAMPPKALGVRDWCALLIITLSRVVMLSPATTCGPSRIGASMSLCPWSKFGQPPVRFCGDASVHPPLQFAASIMQVPTLNFAPWFGRSSLPSSCECESIRCSHHVPLRQIILDEPGKDHTTRVTKTPVDMCLSRRPSSDYTNKKCPLCTSYTLQYSQAWYKMS